MSVFSDSSPGASAFNDPAPGSFRISSDFTADVSLDKADTFFGSVLTCLQCGQQIGPVRDAPTAVFYVKRHRRETHGIPFTEGEPYYVPDVCSAIGCERIAQTKGFCRSHYSQLRHYKGIQVGKHLRPADFAPCSVDGCWRLANPAGLCSSHANRKRAGYAL